MSFYITARTILHLGSELISSDAVAIYELVKNAIDAGSKNGVEVTFDVVIRQSDFASAMALLDTDELSESSLEDVQMALLAKVNSEAPEELKDKFTQAVQGARTKASLVTRANAAYRDCNRITVLDSGHGMSRKDLEDIYLTIGTTHRTDAVRKAIEDGAKKPPYLGEKGVGRLSVMRLGWKVRVETATENETQSNVLDIDWRRFEEAYDQPASSVKITPEPGVRKPRGESFTRIVISDLRSSWSYSRLAEIAKGQIAKMTDPFSWTEKRRFQIRLSINGVPVPQVRAVAKDLLDDAHGKCIGTFSMEKGSPVLRAKIESRLYAGDGKEYVFDLVDLMGMAGLRESGQPTSVLKTLGPFGFEFYWFNRQRLRAVPNVGDRETVRALVKAWAGICLFRDGYRVLPYGDEGDDWLGLDLEALAASGYKLNTKQIIGRVTIGRVSNPRLLDQTNRQGLIECPEKEVLIGLLRKLIAGWWHDFLNEANRAQKRQDTLQFDSLKESSEVENLEQRATQSIKEIRTHYTGEARLLREVKDAFLEIKDAHQRAVERIGAIEEEKERLTQLAGVGLMIEVIAHELTRATELTQATLKDLSRKDIGDEASSALKVLGQQIRVIQKRLQTLEPLSITARQRRSHIRLAGILEYILESHAAQFDRHNIRAYISKSSENETIGFVIEGHIVQILENLINNSVYWLDLQRKEHPSFKPEIILHVISNPPRIRYFDNGPGIPKSRVESVFEPFFSTKGGSKSRRQGLGLYIARQNAEFLGGTLNLVDLDKVHENRYNTFEVELREGTE